MFTNDHAIDVDDESGKSWGCIEEWLSDGGVGFLMAPVIVGILFVLCVQPFFEFPLGAVNTRGKKS